MPRRVERLTNAEVRRLLDAARIAYEAFDNHYDGDATDSRNQWMVEPMVKLAEALARVEEPGCIYCGDTRRRARDTRSLCYTPDMRHVWKDE